MSREMSLLDEALNEAVIVAEILELILWPARVLTTARGPPAPATLDLCLATPDACIN